VGKERSTIANALRLLRLPVEIKRDVAEDRITMGHARALLTLEDPEEQKAARDEIVKGRLSVRETEALVKRKKNKVAPAKPKKQVEDADTKDLVERMQRHFAAKVAIKRAGRGGKLEISFGDLKELTRIIDILNI
ncbi:ParB/RepB/Spo0J family partition protein, partial [Geomonas sp.]|uniref:ParB/RepB/Spo0J family partition protein n=1 Tax=Geomonas sp. TaxID=2651584 RepID=UPI002C4FF887|nr:chromosome partitioning protein ParB [Geomonas sp.]